MPNKILRDPVKSVKDSVTTWYFLYELCQGGSAVADETVQETADGVLDTFSALSGNWVKSDGNVAVTGDITAKVDASPVTINSIDAESGTVTLAAAPAADAAVTLSYSKCDGLKHQEIVVAGADMTDENDSAEAKTKANTAASAARTAYLAQIAAEPVKTTAALSGTVTLLSRLLPRPCRELLSGTAVATRVPAGVIHNSGDIGCLSGRILLMHGTGSHGMERTPRTRVSVARGI